MKLQNGMYANRFGLPFDVYLARALTEMKKRVDKKKAACLIVDGSVGEGKTTLAVHCADFLNGAYVHKKPQNPEPFKPIEFQGFYELDESKLIKLEKQYSMGGEEFQQVLLDCVKEKFKVIIYDEAGDFSRRGALTGLNQNLNRIFETYRTFKIILILCLPSVATLDRDIFLKGVPRALLHCQGRDENAGFFKAFSLKQVLWALHDMKTHPVPQLVYNKLTPNFTGLFYDLPESRSKQLEEISSKGKLNILEEQSLGNDKYLTIGQIAVKYKASPRSIESSLKVAGATPDKEINGQKYYDKSNPLVSNVIALLEIKEDKRKEKMKHIEKLAKIKAEKLEAREAKAEKLKGTFMVFDKPNKEAVE